MTNSDRTEQPLVLHLFGPFEARVDGQPLPRLRTRKGQLLLALLALRAGSEVERAWVAGLLWPDSSDALAAQSLRTSLADLRRALGSQAGRLRSPRTPIPPLARGTGPGILALDLSSAEVDVLAFDGATARGDVPSLEQAVSLYRGPLLEGCREEWVFQERQAREQAYLRALETLAADALARGNPAAAEQYLRRAVGVDPLRESAQRGLIHTLAVGGNYAAAMQVYRELRVRLHQDLNTTPDPETQALFEQIRTEARNKAALGSRLPALGEGRGTRDGLGLEAFAHNLPIQVTSFVGREAATAEVKRLLTTTRLLTLTGAGGCGKTRLALQVAADLLDGESDGAWFVDLSPLTGPALVPQTVAAVLGIREEPGRPLTEWLVEVLLPKKLLLILDNCEHLLEACATLAEALLRRCPGVQILATSRERLNISGETTYRIPSLSSPDPSTLHTPHSTPTQYEAVRLFIDRAIAVAPAFTVTNTNAPAVAEICYRLDGIPLAIELAAARVRVLSAEQIAARLDDRFRLLTGGSRASLPRHQTLRALIDWSYDLLAEPERTLLRRLSVFAGGWTLEAAEAVCSDFGFWIWDFGLPTAQSSIQNPKSKIQNGEVLDLLTSLVDKSLVQYGDRAGEGRYRLLETIRQYSRERLEEAGDAAAVQVRHCEWFLSLAERAEPELWGPRQVEWLDRLEREHDNLRAALAWCQRAGVRGQGSGVSSGKNGLCSSPSLTPDSWPLPPAEMGLRLGGALWRFWELRGYFGEGREHLAGLLALPGVDARTAVRARALRSAGVMAHYQGDCGAVRAYCEESLAIFREVGDRSGVAWSLGYLRWAATYQGDHESARALAEESLAAFREAGDQPGIAWSLISLTWAVAHQGDYGAARALAEESLGISREIDYKEGIAWALGALADLAHYAGDYGTARALYEESLTMQRELGNRFGIAVWLFDLGEVCRAQGDYGEARALHRESLAICRQQGSKRMIVRNLEGLAAVAIEQAQYERAARLYGAAEGLRAANGDAPLSSAAPAAYERRVTPLRAALGKKAFAAAWEAGRTLPLEAAVCYALDETEAG